MYVCMYVCMYVYIYINKGFYWGMYIPTNGTSPGKEHGGSNPNRACVGAHGIL